MEFEYNDKHYRVDRGVGTGKWLLLEKINDDRRGYRLIDDFDAAIYDEDIIDAVKSKLLQNGSA